MQCVVVYTIMYMQLSESIMYINHTLNCIYMGKLRILLHKYLNIIIQIMLRKLLKCNMLS